MYTRTISDWIPPPPTLFFKLYFFFLAAGESGVIGPFNALTNIATLRFRSQYSSPPTLILALSDLATLNLNTPLSFQIRPGQITTTEATVTFMDNTNSIEAANISYMVCPNAKGDVINNI